MRPTDSDDPDNRVYLSRGDEQGATSLAARMEPREWVAHIQFVSLMMIYPFDVTFDSNHRVKTISEVQPRVPHD